MTNLYLILICILVLVSFFLFYKLYKFSILIIEIEDTLEECLDELDERYKSVGRILEKEIFFDSIEVRQVIEDIRITHDLILSIANKLTKNVRNAGEIKKENN
jgi:hypothetical protein